MHLLGIACFVALGVLSECNPTPIRPDHKNLSQRKHPEPSAYPGTGTAFTNEWKYINFDMNDEAQAAAVETIHNAFDGMRRIALAGLSDASGTEETIFGRFFDLDLDLDPSDSEEDERTTEVIPVFRNIIPSENADGSPNSNDDVNAIFTEFIIDNEDFNKADGREPNCQLPGVQAYTEPDQSRTHFCLIGLEIVDVSTLSCESDLDDFPSDKMDNTGRVALHEVVHYNQIGKAATGFQIVDVDNKDGEQAYGPDRAHALVEEEPGFCTANADNYAWMAMNAFMAQKECKQGDFQDPPPYPKGVPQDPED